jgi:hypothetical protein
MTRSSSLSGSVSRRVALLVGSLVLASFPALEARAQAQPSDAAYLGLVVEHYRVAPEEVRVLVRAGAVVEELPVPLRISHRSGIPPTVLLTLHRRGDSWLGVARRYGLGAEIFHVAIPPDQVDDRIRRVWELYRDTPEARWSTLSLSDHEVVTLANLQFLVRATGSTPGRVLEARAQAGSFPGAVSLLLGRP